MTREEMIEQLENTILLIKQNGKDWWDERDIPILEEAIKAMKMEPCEDCISRQAVLDLANNMVETAIIPYRPFQKAVKELPFVQPEQKTGHWIDTDNYFMGAYRNIDYVECSCCHEDSLEEGDYCPNCGAKMEEGVNKE